MPIFNYKYKCAKKQKKEKEYMVTHKLSGIV